MHATILTVLIFFSSTAQALQITREAELASRVGEPMKILRSASAQGGKYLSSEKDFEGTASFSVAIPENGTYTLAARVLASDLASDSFYIAVNDQPKQIWQLPISRSFEWNTYGKVFVLKKGVHTIRFYGRDKGTGLDSIVLTRAPK